MKVILLTLSPEASFLERLYLWFKKYIKSHVFYYGGPEAVLESLISGFDILGVDYQLNPKVQDISGVVCVVSGVNALKWAIKAKKEGKIKKIVAGPNIIVTPEDANGILLNEVIDLVIVPSQWVKDFYASFKKGFDKKIRVWAAGVENPKDFQKNPRQGCLVYKKSVGKELFNFIIQYLESRNIDYKIIKYGRYKKEKYFEMLNKVKFMICLSESESQGLALQEAWIRDVPTFVWNRGYMQWNNYKWYDDRISAPYLTDECGMFFKDKGDFVNKFNIFIKNFSNFKPREYSLENFTNKISAKNYLNIVNSLYGSENTKARNYR